MFRGPLHAYARGAKVIMATKLRLGDSNTVMAQGGMQVAIADEDSPVQHFLDTLKGGHMKNDHQLLKVMVEEGPSIARWLLGLGVLFDRDSDGNLHVKKGGGSSKPRLLTCSDYTGLELMRVLKDEVLNQKIQLLEFSAAIELLSDGNGTCTGAVLGISITIGSSPWPQKRDSRHRGHRAAAHPGLSDQQSLRRHGRWADTGLPAWRQAPADRHVSISSHGRGLSGATLGALVTEGIRSEGGHLVNAKGERFVNELDTRDVVSSSIIRECEEGRGVRTTTGHLGVWLDTPLLDVEHGAGTLEKHFPAMVRQYKRYGLDISKDPVLIYPTLHYQNGGVQIDVNGESDVQNLFVAGEASGGLHGRNRLMGNSLLDLMVFGKRSEDGGLVAGCLDAARTSDTQSSYALPGGSPQKRRRSGRYFAHVVSGLHQEKE